MRAMLLALVAAGGIVTAFAGEATAHHSRSIEPPTKVSVIERVYPVAYRKEVSRAHPSWSRLRRAIEPWWRKQHPAAVRAETVHYLDAHPTPFNARRLAFMLYPDLADQWGMDVVFGGESGWWVYATNTSSGACGLGQAYPCSKMAAWLYRWAYWARGRARASRLDLARRWRSSPLAQLRYFMEGYTPGRWGTIATAAAQWIPTGHGGATW